MYVYIYIYTYLNTYYIHIYIYIYTTIYIHIYTHRTHTHMLINRRSDGAEPTAKHDHDVNGDVYISLIYI